MQRVSTTHRFARDPEGKPSTPWLEEKERQALGHWALCSLLLGAVGHGRQPPPAASLSLASVGEGEKAGVRPALTRKMAPGVGVDCAPHPQGTALIKRWKKPVPLSAAFIIQNSPQSGACCGGV